VPALCPSETTGASLSGSREIVGRAPRQASLFMHQAAQPLDDRTMSSAARRCELEVDPLRGPGGRRSARRRYARHGTRVLRLAAPPISVATDPIRPHHCIAYPA
jgi:hypothetical protein